MSLRIFHIVFVVASILLSLLLGVWGIRFYLLAGGARWLGFGVLFFVVGLGLVIYGVRVWEKLKEV